MGGHQDHRACPRGILERGDPEGEVKGEEETRKETPAQGVPPPSSPYSAVCGEGDKDEGGDTHPIRGNNQGGCITELDKNRGRGYCQDPYGEKNQESHHTLFNVSYLGFRFKSNP